MAFPIAIKPSLLTLPAELRDEIYTLVLKQETPLESVSYVIRNGWRDSYLRPPALAQICRQIRQEAIPIFYSTNTFVFQNVDQYMRNNPLTSPAAPEWQLNLASPTSLQLKHVKSVLLNASHYRVAFQVTYRAYSEVIITARSQPENLGRCVCEYEDPICRLFQANSPHEAYSVIGVAHNLYCELWKMRRRRCGGCEKCLGMLRITVTATGAVSTLQGW